VDMVVLNETGVKGEPERMPAPGEQAEAVKQEAAGRKQAAPETKR
jgi:hypothetical protein